MTHDNGSCAAQQVCIEFPVDARAVLVSRNNDGSVRTQAVGERQSILNLQNDLFRHLSEYPCSDEWLVELRDFAVAKLQSRQAAKGAKGISIPHPCGRGFAVVTDYQLLRGCVEVR